MISLALQSAPQRAVERHRPLVIVFGVLVLVAALYWPTSLEIAELWEDDERLLYTHGWLLLAVTIWLVWRDRAQIDSIEPAPPRAGWTIVALGSMGWLVGYYAGLQAVTMLALPALAIAAVWAAGGRHLARRISFAVSYLVFALPVWEPLIPWLQSSTARVNLWLTGAAGIPVTMDGNVIQIPAGAFEIAGGCSGLRFFVVALAIAALQGEINRERLRDRLVLLALAAGLAMLANWIRVFALIVIGHLSAMQHYLVRVDHYYFGWIVFAIALVIYLYLASRLPRSVDAGVRAATSCSRVPRARKLVATAATTAALALGPAWSLAGSQSGTQHEVAVAPPLAGWSGPGLYLSDWRPVFVGADEEIHVAYHREPRGEIALYRAVYRSQRQGKELHGYGNSILGDRYRLLEASPREIVVDGASIRPVEHRAASADRRELLVWSLFTLDGRPERTGLAGQLNYGLRSLVQRPVTSVVAWAAECRPDCNSARVDLEDAASISLSALLSGSSSLPAQTPEAVRR